MAGDFNRPSLSQRPFIFFSFNNKVSEQKCKDGIEWILGFFWIEQVVNRKLLRDSANRVVYGRVKPKMASKACQMVEGPATRDDMSNLNRLMYASRASSRFKSGVRRRRMSSPF